MTVDENTVAVLISDILIQMPQQENQIDITPADTLGIKIDFQDKDISALPNSKEVNTLIENMAENQIEKLPSQSIINNDENLNVNQAYNSSVTQQINIDVPNENKDIIENPIEENINILQKTDNKNELDVSKNDNVGSLENTLHTAEIKVTNAEGKDFSDTKDDLNGNENLKQTKVDEKEVNTEILQKPFQMIRITDSSTKLDKPVETPVNVQVADAIKTNLSEGKKEFEIQLMPENLGKISVKLVLENGALSVEMKAVNPKTQSLLAENSAEIKSILENASQKVVDVPQQQTPQDYVQQQSKNQQQQNQQQQQKGNQEKNDTSTIDFISMMQQIKNKSIMA